MHTQAALPALPSASGELARLHHPPSRDSQLVTCITHGTLPRATGQGYRVTARGPLTLDPFLPPIAIWAHGKANEAYSGGRGGGGRVRTSTQLGEVTRHDN